MMKQVRRVRRRAKRAPGKWPPVFPVHTQDSYTLPFNRLLSAIEDFAGSVEIPAGQRNRTFSQNRFAFSTEEADSSNFNGITFSTNTRDDFDSGTIGTSPGTSVPSDSVASVVLPPEILAGRSGAQRFSFVIFSGDTLFQSQTELSEDSVVGSVIISATLHGYTVTQLSKPVIITFEKAVVGSK